MKIKIDKETDTLYFRLDNFWNSRI